MAGYFKDGEHSKLYFDFRPKPTDEVYKILAEKFLSGHQSPAPRTIGKVGDLAVDVGCGPGLSSVALLEYFIKVIGVDASESQIAEAKKNYGDLDPNKIAFHCQDAEALSDLVGESSVDMVMVIEAIHWFNRSKFYDECTKVLKPVGLVAAVAYGMHELEDARAEEIRQYFFDQLTAYKDPRTSCFPANYDVIFHEFKQHFTRVDGDDSQTINMEMSLDDYIGYLSTFSYYRKYLKFDPDQKLLQDVKERFVGELSIEKDFNKRGFQRTFSEENPKMKRKFQVYIIFGWKDDKRIRTIQDAIG